MAKTTKTITYNHFAGAVPLLIDPLRILKEGGRQGQATFTTAVPLLIDPLRILKDYIAKFGREPSESSIAHRSVEDTESSESLNRASSASSASRSSIAHRSVEDTESSFIINDAPNI